MNSSRTAWLSRETYVDLPTEWTQTYTTFGFTASNYYRYWRTYTDADKLCSNFIRDVKLFPQENRGLIDEIYYSCTCYSNPILLNTTLYIHISLLAPIVVCIMKFNYMRFKASLNNQRGPLPPPPPPVGSALYARRSGEGSREHARGAVEPPVNCQGIVIKLESIESKAYRSVWFREAFQCFPESNVALGCPSFEISPGRLSTGRPPTLSPASYPSGRWYNNLSSVTCGGRVGQPPFSDAHTASP